MDDTRSARLAQFVEWSRAHITGDEKGQAQIFLDRLFQAFGQRGSLDVGGKPEFRIKKRGDDDRGTTFADYVWKPIVLIEMKKRGVDLTRAFRQAFDYWIRLVPNRPKYTILCNFDEFWIYDFNEDINEPLDRLTLDELPAHYEALAFLFPTRETPKFRLNRLEVTRKAADLLADVYKDLEGRRDVAPGLAQRFILQMLIALFSEDIGLLPKHFVTQLLDECIDPPKTFDLLGGLFRAMATQGGIPGGRYRDVPYFNGGIFAEPAPVELQSENVNRLKTAAQYDWSKISPDIFGTLFQHSMKDKERRSFGAHYTTPHDIMKIVKPTIVEPWETAIEEATSLTALRRLQQRMTSFRILDPACGSGNFLYIAYRELKRIEVDLIRRMHEVAPRQKAQAEIGHVSSRQFFGMDIVPFAVELAKVTMTLAHKLAIDELHIEERALPLDNLDANIRCVDALIDWPIDGAAPPDFDPKKARERTEWPAADVIIGNPPFVGAKLLKPWRGSDYVNALRKAYPKVPGMADYCVYWIRRSHDHLPLCTPEDPFRGRAGLVGTQNIRNNQSRVGGLDHVVSSGGTIVEAVDNQPWSGEANVHVSIANWVKHAPAPVKIPGADVPDDETERLLIPKERRLWTKAEASMELFDPPPAARGRKATTVPGKRGTLRKDKSYELVDRLVPMINSALSDEVDLGRARVLACNRDPKRVFQGVTPGHDGFVLTPAERRELVAKERASAKVTFPYLVGRELLTGQGQPERALIDFQQRTVLEAQQFPCAFKRIEERVLPDRRKKAEEGRDSDGNMRPHHRQFLERWWKLAWDRADMVAAIARLKRRYLVCSRVTKRPIFVFVSREIRPGDALQAFIFEDDYSFGILSASAHWEWFVAKSSKLKSDFRYTPESVFDTFPWPQSPTTKQVEAVAEAGRAIRRIRDEVLPTINGGLRALYRTLELPGRSPLKDAHAALDAAVLDCYGFSSNSDLLADLLALNLDVARRIETGKPVTAPGVPPSYGDPAPLITDDCIRA